MCRAITGAFTGLRADGTGGLPRNSPSCTARAQGGRRPVLGRTMRSPMDELVFTAHSQHAVAEMQALGDDTAARITDSPALTEMLRRPEAPTRQCSRAALPIAPGNQPRS